MASKDLDPNSLPLKEFLTPNKKDKEESVIRQDNENSVKRRKIVATPIGKKQGMSDIREFMDSNRKALFTKSNQTADEKDVAKEMLSLDNIKLAINSNTNNPFDVRRNSTSQVSAGAITNPYCNQVQLLANFTSNECAFQPIDTQEKKWRNCVKELRCDIEQIKEVLPNIMTDHQVASQSEDKLPEDMTSQQMMSMLYDINSSITEIKQNMQSQQESKSTLHQLLSKMVGHTQTFANYMIETQEFKQEISWQVNRLIGTVVRQEQIIQELRKKDERRELNEIKCIFFLDNLPASKKENTTAVVREFIAKRMKISKGAKVVKAFRTGNNEPKTIKVEMASSNDRQVIFDNIGNLKNEKNSNNKRFFLNKAFPARIREEKRRERDIMKINATIPVALRPTIEKEKDGLYIGEEKNKYTKQVTAPTTSELFKENRLERNQRYQLRITQGNTIKNETSTFVGYSAFVRNYSDIKKAYLNVKDKHADARHVCCAYRLPGVETAFLQDFVDDDEPGGGKALLNLLVEMDTFNRAIFVVRYYPTAEHIGSGRFVSMQQAALSAIIKAPNNSVNGEREMPEVDLMTRILNDTNISSIKPKGKITTEPGQKVTVDEESETEVVMEEEPEEENEEPINWSQNSIKGTPIKTNTKWQSQEDETVY